jgi:hypothetical protein
MNFVFSNHKELFAVIGGINKEYREPIDVNIKAIEVYNRESAIQFWRKLKDIDALFSRLFDNDLSVLSPVIKGMINKHLEHYLEQLQELLYKTYKIIFNIKFNIIMNKSLDKNKQAIRTQIVLEMIRAGIKDNNTIEEKIKGFPVVLSFLDNTIKKYNY